MAQTFKVVDGDIVISGATGRPTLISGATKLRQDIKEFFTVDILPNGFGSGLEQLIGVVESSPDMFMSMGDRQIRDGLVKFINLIRGNTLIARTPAEIITNVTNIIFSVDTTDPTKFYFNANFVTQDGTTIPLSNILPT
jgi:hypothetical protein